MDKKQKILIIGGGGREHAIGWKVSQSPRAGELFFAPGNGGTLALGKNVDIKATDIFALIDFVKKEKIDLTLALPDDPLALGIVDEFQKQGLRIFGPTKAAAQLESSKAFAKRFMQSHNLPTAKFQAFTEFEKALEYLKNHPLPVVVKASGLALGKGVVIAQTFEEAEKALDDMMVKKVFGEGGNEVVIEEFLTGPEISIHAFSDGTHYSIFPSGQDHKRIEEGNTGLNTGGMGTIAPLPFADDALMQKIEKEIVAPTLSAMSTDGMPFAGVLYPGLMLTKEAKSGEAGSPDTFLKAFRVPKILEFNARFGDPETETYMRLLETDILDIADACIDSTLDTVEIKWKPISACTIILASGGYPEKYEKGKIISGIEEAEKNPDVVVFHAGTAMKDGMLVTNGGRVLGVSATGATLKEALATAYDAISKIHFEGMYYRKDIGADYR